MRRVVLDPNVIVSALIAPCGTSRQAVDAALADDTDLILTAQWLREISEVVARSRFRRWFSAQSAESLVAELWRGGIVVDDPVRFAPLGPDPDDDYLLALAGANDAVLVTGDHALLEHPGKSGSVHQRRFSPSALHRIPENAPLARVTQRG
ncbi:MAG: putative toxin-antitoxin system toxin component, PIN family [Actinomycetota bacterium]